VRENRESSQVRGRETVWEWGDQGQCRFRYKSGERDRERFQ
jgi:hypothetical protein